jgi:SAM-dependent methyltransferase
VTDHDTLAFYARTASAYAARSAGHVSRHLAPFLKRLPAKASILELGCGGGHEARAMLDAGHAVDPTDGVAEMAAAAQALLPCPVRVMRFDELDAVERYDGVWANGALLHVARAALPGILERIHTALKPGGLFHATYKTGSAEDRDGFGRLFNYPSPAQLEEMHARGWDVLGIETYLDESYHGRGVTPWSALLARKMPG